MVDALQAPMPFDSSSVKDPSRSNSPLIEEARIMLRMSLPAEFPRPNGSDVLNHGPEIWEDDHDQDLIEWLHSYGVRTPDWSFDPCILDQKDGRSVGEEKLLKRLSQSDVSGVYLFYSRSKEGVIALYVGKAARLRDRMQTHWCRHGERGWINSYLDDIDSGDLNNVVMACAWNEEERAGMEAKLIRILKPKYCRRQE